MKSWLVALSVFAAPLCSAAPPTLPQGVIRWNFDGEPCSLQYNVVENKALTKCSLHMIFQRHMLWGTLTSELTDTFNDLTDIKKIGWAEIKLALPIRVQGSHSPQILIKLYRSNFIDYKLYTVGADGIEQAFGFSTRNPGDIKWVSSGKSLKYFITYERYYNYFGRFATVPKRDPSIPKDAYTQLVTKWVYNQELSRWQPMSKRWMRAKYGYDVVNPVISKPSDCPFRYPQELLTHPK